LANHFDINRLVAVAHIRAEQLKAFFLATAKLLLILLAGLMLFFGVILAATDIHLKYGITWRQLLDAGPVAIVAGLVAICIEGGTLFSASFVKESQRKVKQELDTLKKVEHKFTAEEVKKRQRTIKGQLVTPYLLMAVCVGFSVSGAEIFWQKLLEDQGVFFHVIGAVMGVTVSSLLIFFEFNEALIQRIIEKCISSSALIMLALDQSAKSQIHNELFNERSKKLKTPEFKAVIAQAAETGLHGVLSDALEMSGVTVSAEQLRGQVNDEKESRAAAEQFLASGGNPEPVMLQVRSPRASTGRMTDERKRVIALKRKYGTTRIMDDPETYAQEAQVNVKTLKRWLSTEQVV
jgi:ABC-type Fe3+-siderophore transport system permease subunit